MATHWDLTGTADPVTRLRVVAAHLMKASDAWASVGATSFADHDRQLSAHASALADAHTAQDPDGLFPMLRPCLPWALARRSRHVVAATG